MSGHVYAHPKLNRQDVPVSGMALGLVEDFAEWAAQHDDDCVLQQEMRDLTLKLLARLGYTPPANAADVWVKLLDLLDARRQSNDMGPAWSDFDDGGPVDFDAQIRETKHELCGQVAP